MKKILSILLTIAIVFGLCACGSSGNEEKKPEGLQVGFGKIDVTPDFSVGLGGLGDDYTRRSEGLISYVYITCIAISENDNTILLYTMDFSGCNESTAELIRSKVSPETGVPVENIFCGATHNHSGPSAVLTDDAGLRYQALWQAKAIEAAKEAIADMAPATISSAKQEIENMNFVRHYKMADGTHAGSNFGSFKDSEIVGHSVEGDHEMTLVKFDRPEGKEDVLLVNWHAHPASANQIGRNNIASDFVGPFRDKVEALTGMKVAYFTGASGNMNPESKIASEDHRLDIKKYGEKLAEYAIAALANLAPIEGSGIKIAPATKVVLDIDHSWDHMVAEAKEVYEISETNPSHCVQLCKKYNFSSYHQARTIIRRADMSLTGDRILHAFSVGGLGFVNGDYEMFTESGMYIKENSPFDTTFIISGNSGYLATEIAYDYRSYEADTSYYAKGSAEKLAGKLVEMLNSLA